MTPEMEHEREPRTLHLLVRGKGGGTETNVNRLCHYTEHFERLAFEEEVGYPISPLRIPKAIFAIRKRKPEVIFCYGITTHLLAFLAYPFGGPALVGNIRCVSDFTGVKHWLLKLIQWRFSEWLSNSKAALAEGQKGYVIYNGVLAPPSDEQPMFTDLKKPVFGLVARDHPKKGHDFFIDVWKQSGKPGTVIFAGELGDELKARAEAEGIVCPGFVEAGPLMRSLDMLVSPSLAEGIPTVALEAMNRGVPVLATPAGGTGELVQHGRTGYLLPREEWAAFLPKIDWKEAKATGDRGRQHVRQYFSYAKMQKEFEFVAMQVLRQKRERKRKA